MTRIPSLSSFAWRVFAVLAIVAATGCTREDLKSYRGVTEGEVVRLSAPVAGNLSSLEVSRGAMVTEGTKLFSQADAEEISAHADAEKRLNQLEQDRGKKNGARADEVESLKAAVAEAEWKLMLKSASAPVNGVVTEMLHAKGDWVPAGAPVLTILPVDKIKVSFEVPLSVAAHLQHGRSVTLLCDQCESAVQATITYVSPFATQESAPGSASELHYRVEARPAPQQAALLKPGQSVTVNL
ncbi:MAG TPA: HlyD family efflux transporter periplasmic adaptor subunit [Burkholderiales bacterium]|nr:HlyD family efflux transporter periplasmic adaptor subunit [Burkholderiales bacterium]